MHPRAIIRRAVMARLLETQEFADRVGLGECDEVLPEDCPLVFIRTPFEEVAFSQEIAIDGTKVSREMRELDLRIGVLVGGRDNSDTLDYLCLTVEETLQEKLRCEFPIDGFWLQKTSIRDDQLHLGISSAELTYVVRYISREKGFMNYRNRWLASSV